MKARLSRIYALLVPTFLLATSPTALRCDDLVPPEVVRLDSWNVEGELKILIVGNSSNHYLMTCDVKAEGCITPKQDADYWLIDKDTHWTIPSAKEPVTLGFIQDWTVTYKAGENVGLVQTQGKGEGLGLFLLDRRLDGYFAESIISDGPIIYGTGLNDNDRKSAWKHFVLQMVEACNQQQGSEVCKLKLARRCEEGQEQCTMTLDAKLTGVAGSDEPTNVILILATDPQDSEKQLGRMVCTTPTKGMQVCRNWDTGELVPSLDILTPDRTQQDAPK